MIMIMIAMTGKKTFSKFLSCHKTYKSDKLNFSK